MEKIATPKLIHLEPPTEISKEFHFDFGACLVLCLPDWKHCWWFLPLCLFFVPVECHPDCLTCSQSFDHCNACRDTRKQLQNGHCVETCASGFYQDGGTCLGNFCKGLYPVRWLPSLWLAVLLFVGSHKLIIRRLPGFVWKSFQARTE